MKHKDKVKLARKLREKEAAMTMEPFIKRYPKNILSKMHVRIMKTPIFQTQLWDFLVKRNQRKVDQAEANRQMAKYKRSKKYEK